MTSLARASRFSRAALLVALTASCSSPADHGDGGTLTITHRTPEENERISARAVIDTQFSAPLRSGIHVASDCVEIRGQDASIFDLSLPSEDTIRLAPHAALAVDDATTFQIVFHSPCIAGRDGGELASGSDHTDYLVPTWASPYPGSAIPGAEQSCARPHLVSARDGSIFAACTVGNDAGRVVVVMHGHDNVWERLGTSPPVGGVDEMLRGLALDANDAPFVLFASRTPTAAPSFQLLHWGPAGFETVGPAFVSNYEEGNLVIDATGAPVFGTEDARALTIHRWNGTAFEDLGSQPIEPPGSLEVHAPTLAVDAHGVLYEAYAAAAGAQATVSVKRWDGTNWTIVGAPFDGWLSPEMVFDATGAPIVFTTFLSSSQQAVMRFDGTQWVRLGAIFAEMVTTISNERHLAAGPMNALYVMSRVDEAIRFSQWNGTDWIETFPRLPVELGARAFAFMVPNDGVPVVLIDSESSSGAEGLVRRLNR